MSRIPLRRRILASALVPLLATVAFSGAAHAEIGFPDTVPAATLLLPYFAVDLGDPNGAQTRFSVINTGAAPRLAKVTLWSNLGVPTFSFDLYLEGRDTVEVDLRQVFAGLLPRTGPGLITLGGESDPSATFAGCGASANEALGVSLPVPTRLSSEQVAHLAAAHTGRQSASMGNMCAGVRLGDNVARGYATVDVVNECAVSNPTVGGYFATGGTGLASNANVLAGTFTLNERPQELISSSSPLVHIEASDTNPLTSIDPPPMPPPMMPPPPDTGDYTFYASYNAGDTSDNREALGGVWQVPLPGNPQFDAGTDLIVWRDAGGRAPIPFMSATCTAPSSVFPLGQSSLYFFDESETFFRFNVPPPPPNPPTPELRPFPYATQIVDASTLTPFPAGWAILNLNLAAPVPATPGGTIMNQPALRQSVVLVRSYRGTQAAPLRPGIQSANVGHQEGGANSCSLPGAASPCNSFTGVVF